MVSLGATMQVEERRELLRSLKRKDRKKVKRLCGVSEANEQKHSIEAASDDAKGRRCRGSGGEQQQTPGAGTVPEPVGVGSKKQRHR